MIRAGAALLAVGVLMPISAVAAKCGPAMVQVTVLDQGGTSLSGLAPSDFKVRLKGQNVNVAAVDYGVFPHSTLLLVSRTSSMSQSIKVELARQLANVIVTGAPGNVMAGTFGADVSGVSDARTNPVFGAGLQPGSDNRNTIFDAILAGMTTVNLHRGDSIVVVTDSPDNGSHTTTRELEQRFAATGARLFVIALPPASGLGMQSLTDLADASGGGVIVPIHVDDTTKGVVITPAQVEAAVTNLTQSYSQYSNIYQLETDVDGQDKAVPLKVEVDRRKLGAGKVVAPVVLAPCTSIGQ
jgi:hypothetical protein